MDVLMGSHDLPFRAALVTGAGGRLGQAMAIWLAKQGIKVAVHYANSSAGADDTLRQIEEAVGKGFAQKIQADLLDDQAVADLIPEASKLIGAPFDILVNNASIFEYDRLETASLSSWDRHLGSNLKAPLFLSQAFAEQAPKAARDANDEMIARSVIVNLIDMRVRKLTPEFMTYTLAKSALWTFTQTAAQGLAPNIRVNAIGPGPTLKGARQSQTHFDNQRRATVLERGPDPEDICDALGYILRARALTGQLLCVDGGQHLGWQTPDVLGVEE